MAKWEAEWETTVDDVTGGVILTKYIGDKHKLISIPEKIGDKNIVSIKGTHSLHSTGIFGQEGPTGSSGADFTIEEVDLSKAIHLKSITDFAFAYCNNLKKITLPPNLEEIGTDAFHHCNLEYLELPNSVKSIGDQAFQHNIYLKDIIFSSNLEKIGFSAFQECELLTSLTFPSKLKTIENNAFYNCFNIENVILNEGLETIGIGSFALCAKLATLTIKRRTLPLTNIEFSGSTFNGTPVKNDSGSKIYYPNGTSYQSIGGWQTLNGNWIGN